MIFLDNKGPLMFINTTQTNTNFKTGNNIYDIIITKRKKIQETSNNTNADNVSDTDAIDNSDYDIKIDLEKLRNVTTLYSYKMPVLCQFNVNNEEVVGVPTNLLDNELDLLVNDSHIKISLNDIIEFKILEF